MPTPLPYPQGTQTVIEPTRINRIEVEYDPLAILNGRTGAYRTRTYHNGRHSGVRDVGENPEQAILQCLITAATLGLPSDQSHYEIVYLWETAP